MRAIIIIFAVVAVAGGGAAYFISDSLNADPPPSLQVAAIVRGDLVTTINATGTVEPEEVINVGAQVAGKIESFGRDPHDPTKQVDWGTEVEEGTVLAVIDPTLYKAQVDQAAASLAEAKADVLQLQAKADQTEQEWKRAQSLKPMKAIADTDHDLAKANCLVAKANVEIGKATIQRCEAALTMAKANLDYTVIRSPVKGVVISRRVNKGQTVVASLNAPSIFLLAKDLRKMQIWAQVNEADVGRIRPGQPVHFTVDAFPEQTFEGKVLQVRLDAQTSQNVVVYTVVVTTDNSDGQLLPYLTANLNFEVDRHSNVLKVPNAALRWRPRLTQIAPDARKKMRSTTRPQEGGTQEPLAADSSGAPTATKLPGDATRLWIKDGDLVRPVKVQVGPSDGSMTEVSGDKLREGTEVVIGESRSAGPAEEADETKNPFLPTLRPRGNRQTPRQ